MPIYVSASASRSGDGSKERPFKTISQAAEIAVAGDEVIVAPGVYREWVDPKNGQVTYRSETPLGATITGSEQISDWKKAEGDVWVATIPNSLFGSFNPYSTPVAGDWYWPVKALSLGEVYLNGKALYESANLDEVFNPSSESASWEPENAKYRWHSSQQGDFTVIHANFQGADPNIENVEINVRKHCFYPSKTGVNYITFSGFTVKQASPQWAPPTAYQEGMIGPHWSKGWIIEDCEISDSRCSGISLGKYLQPNNENKWTTKVTKNGTQNERDAICQAQSEGWTKESIGSHIVRRCHIHDCGQAGIVGHLGCVFSIIEDNHIHHINCRQDLAGAEIGGIKMHAAIDVIFRRNHIHHCTRGLWLDWQAQGTRVTQNLFHDNAPPEGVKIDSTYKLGEDIFVEVSHGPTLIDNNILLSPYSAKLCTQGLAFVHNLIAGSFTSVGRGTDNGVTRFPSPRYTPYHIPHKTDVAGFMTFLHGDARFYNNVFIQQDLNPELERALQADALMFETQPDSARFAPPNTVPGTHPYDGYPSAEEYFSRFEPIQYSQLLTETLEAEKSEEDLKRIADMFSRDKYYDHLPVHTGGNVYFNGAKPCDRELGSNEDKLHHVDLALVEKDGKFTLETNYFGFLSRDLSQTVTTELLGEAFEPEQPFENPDGTPIVFNEDYFGEHRAVRPLPGPFENAEELERALNF
ncbi:MAG: right-handed parallel beta-helix repeat-containing protein [Clostridiales bacterium]|jgi:hypothetical protein|nr:right-handed parallel beta-helix repeat-containing protein [Clostridiales bacterium]